MNVSGLGVRQFEFWYRISHQVNPSHQTGTQILYYKNRKDYVRPLRVEKCDNSSTYNVVLQLESTNKAERVKKNITVIPVSLKFLRIIEPTLFF